MVEERLKHAEDLTRIFRHVVGAILTSWQRIFRVGLLTGAFALLVTEIVACFVTSSVPPPPVTHLVAAVLALALGYSVAVTTLIGILLKGGITFIRQLEGEVEIGADAADIFARRKTDDLGAGVRRVIDKRRANTAASRPRTEKPRAADSRWKGEPQLQPIAAQRDARRDPDDAIMTAPVPTLQSLPVSASHMPRIEWANDETQQTPPITAQSFERAPWRDVPTTPDSSPATADQPATLAALDDVTMQTLVASASATDTPESHEAPEESPGASGSPPDEAGHIPRSPYRASNCARPLGASDDIRPSGGVRSGGLWERVSQVLVGQSESPSPHRNTHASQPSMADEVIPENAPANE